VNGAGPYYRPPGMGGGPPHSQIRWFAIAIAAVFIVAAALILLVLLYPASFGLAAPSSPYRFGAFGGVFFLFFILIVVFFIVRVAFWGTRMGRYRGRYYGQDRSGYGPNRPAMVARMRYARGEITREQYNQIMDDIGRAPPPR
jgi:uncharacterized membrane protein